jgi:hypothetical protein
MPTTLDFKDIIDLPDWRPLAVAPSTTAAAVCIAGDYRNSEIRHHEIFQLASATILNAYHVKNDGWSTVINPALTGTFGAGAAMIMMPSRGPRGTIAAGATSSKITLTTALPATVGVNQLAGRGDGIGFTIRIIDNGAGGSGKTEERRIVGNTSSTTPVIDLESALSFTPVSGAAYEILSGRVYMLSAGTMAAGCWKFYDIATNSMSGNLSITNLPATVNTDTSLVGLDEGYTPHTRDPGAGFLGNITATAAAATTITGQASGADAAVLANEYRNFQIRIVQDAVTPTAAGQRRKITSHTAGPSAVYTVPTWTVTPSSSAIFVIENANEIVGWTTAGTATYTYAQDAIGAAAADSWSTATYAARGTAMAAGCSSFQSFGIVPDVSKNARHSFVFSFRGGAATALDILDIAGAATGLWTNTATYGNITTGPATTGAGIVYNGATQLGQFAYLCLNGSTTFYRFNCLTRQLNQWCPLRYTQGTAVLGNKMAMTTYIDGATKVGFVYTMRNTGNEFFQILTSR